MATLRFDNAYRVTLMRPYGAFVRQEDKQAAAKAYAKKHQYKGAQGGWIYDMQRGKTVCQGWQSFYGMFRWSILNELTRELTAFSSFDEMTLRTAPSYRPSIYPYTWRERVLADEYDLTQEARKDERRAYTGFDRYDRSLWETMRRAITARAG